jgi:sodium/potassium-transporting ATPase subunit alpha
MLTSHSLLTIKGAPDVLIGRCIKYTTIEGDSKVLDDTTRAKIEEIKNKWSSQGRRVILLARKTICKEHIRAMASSSQFEDEVLHHAREGLTLVGIVGIVDPPRDEIPSVVKILRGAGIRIFMVRLLVTWPSTLLTFC